MNSAAAPGIDAGRRRRQLPAEVSAFAGRTDELATLAGLLRRGRQVTVTGPAGVGKTRPALRAAADAANRYPGGLCLVELSGLHQTLPGAIDWSYDLCTEAERALWDRLSVFAGSFGLAAARQVAACPLVPAGQVGDVLAGLVDKSVVLREDGPPTWEAPTSSDAARYRLIGSVREYGAERLAAADQEADCRRRHARRYLRMARDFLRHLLADDQTTRLHELRAEHADLRDGRGLRGGGGGGPARAGRARPG